MVWHRVVIADAPWGDYGRILVSGMTERRDESGRVPLLRVGPFVPPITIAGISNLLVTDEFRSRLTSSGLLGFSLAQVWKKRIAKLDWRSWDLTAGEPKQYPAGGEPENYVLGRKHDENVSEQIGPIWEVITERTIDDPADADIVRTAATAFSQLLVNDRGRDWLQEQGGGWLRFEPHAT